MPPRDDASLLDILNAARRIVRFIGDLDAQAFAADDKTQSAILHQLLIIGEATKRVSDETRALAPQVPWRLMAGMRDRLIHAYDDVDPQEVWRTVASDIPQLIAWLEAIAPAAE